jgi:hypothetical protein
LSLSITIKTPAAAPGLAKAPSTDFITGEAILTKGAETRTVVLTIAGGRATANVTGLAAGTWSLTVNFYNAEGGLTFSGTTVVTVRNGKVNPVSITVNPLGGSVGLDISLPITPDLAGNYVSDITYDDGVNWILNVNSHVLTFNEDGVTGNWHTIYADGSVSDYPAEILPDGRLRIYYAGELTGTVSPDGLTIRFDNNSRARRI